MSMNYVVRKKVDKSGDKEVVRYYAASKVLQPEPVSNDELAKRLAFVSSLQVGDAQSVLVQTAGYYSGLSGQWTHGEHQGTWKLFSLHHQRTGGTDRGLYGR